MAPMQLLILFQENNSGNGLNCNNLCCIRRALHVPLIPFQNFEIRGSIEVLVYCCMKLYAPMVFK